MPWEYQHQQYYPPPAMYGAAAAYGGLLYHAYRNGNGKPTPTAVPKVRQRTIESEKILPKMYSLNPGSTKFIHGRPKPYTTERVKGVHPKLKKKIEKVIQHSKVYGKYIYYADKQLRQSISDRYSLYSTDRNSHALEFFSPNQFLDAASVLFSGKAIDGNFNNTAGNLNDDQKFSIQNSYVDIDFKSTSSHVVNLEIYECTAKINTQTNPAGYIANSYNTFDAVVQTNRPALVGIDATFPGTGPSDWVELYEAYSVKTHHIKLLPGQNGKLFIQGPKNRIIDMTKYSSNGSVYYFAKGLTKALFIRVINDATVSQSVTSAGGAFSHHWRSGDYGGVSMVYKRVIRMNPPDSVNASATESINRIRLGLFLHNPVTVTETDQQVAYQMPQQTSIVD